ncbi:hypothetical protein MD484_g6028, partial [Candolleomyces efflorescens]
MDARITLVQRPMGPRPSSSTRRLPTLRTPNPLSPAEPQEEVAQRMASLSLSPPRSNGGTKPKLGIAIGGSVQFESYYGGPIGAPEQHLSPGEDENRTIRPTGNLTIISTQTAAPSRTGPNQPPANPLQNVLNEITATRPAPKHRPSSEPDDQILASPPPTVQWADSMLEEIDRLGEGAGGAVQKVKDKRSGMIMARKTITTREAPMKQLLRELQIMSSTEHVNIIAFYGAYMTPSHTELNILMEFAEGGSLEAVGKRIRERGAIVGEKIAGRIAEGVLQGLAYLHSKRTIHRDIKPSNIVLSREGIVKLCDFGVSGELVASNANTFTGTSFYMAPERICGQDYTIRSDVWSTGISLLELVQNRFPFPTDVPPIELMMYITNGEPPTLEDEPGVQWSEEMKDFIKQSLIVDPQTRPTPKDMLNHPWIITMMKHENTMARWVAQVWGWTRSRKSRDE